MLDQRRRRWPDVVKMLYKCFVFAGVEHIYVGQDTYRREGRAHR